MNEAYFIALHFTPRLGEFEVLHPVLKQPLITQSHWKQSAQCSWLWAVSSNPVRNKWAPSVDQTPYRGNTGRLLESNTLAIWPRTHFKIHLSLLNTSIGHLHQLDHYISIPVNFLFTLYMLLWLFETTSNYWGEI